MKPYPFFITLVLLAACSHGASTAPSGADANPGSTAAAQAPATASGGAPGNPCDVITAADVAGIIVVPVARAPSESAPALCIYQSKKYAKVVINEAHGDDQVNFQWTLATTTNAAENPLGGVGDKAQFDATGTTLVARKGDISCRVDVLGYDNSDAMDDITKDRGEALAKKLGALCNKLFASH